MDDPKTQIETRDTKSIEAPEDFPLKTSGFWELTESIEIDDSATGVGAKNWTWAVAQDWLSGYGNSTHPFLIENTTVTISAGDFGISIINSNSTTYFKISNITVVNTDVSGSGILLNNTYNGEIIDSISSNNGDSGFKLINTHNLTMSGDTANLNVYGIYADNSTTMTIYDGNYNNNTVYGLDFINSTYNSIYGNNITYNDYGVRFEDSDDNDFYTNVVSNNNETGIWVIDSDNCSIYNNDIANNNLGLALTEDNGNSLNNTIWLNDFDANTIHAQDNCSIANPFDNGTIGNDWDNYPDYDGNDDGIGDIVYSVPGTSEATDRYPIYDDGDEPIVLLSDDDDVDELFGDELNLPTIDWTLIAGLSVVGIVCGVGLFFLIKSKIIKPNKFKARVKTRVKTTKRKVKSRARVKRRR